MLPMLHTAVTCGSASMPVESCASIYPAEFGVTVCREQNEDHDAGSGINFPHSLMGLTR